MVVVQDSFGRLESRGANGLMPLPPAPNYDELFHQLPKYRVNTVTAELTDFAHVLARLSDLK